ncbi:MAG: PTS sugar transporter subunit IIA [Elusimicrobiota bacterium]
MNYRPTKLLTENCIKPDLKGEDAGQVIPKIVDLLVRAGKLDPGQAEGLTGHIIESEKKKSSATGEGLAIIDIHSHSAAGKKPAIALGVSQRGVDMNSLDGKPVNVICLVLGKSFAQLQALADITDILDTPGMIKRLLECTTPGQIYRLIKDAQDKLLKD